MLLSIYATACSLSQGMNWIGYAVVATRLCDQSHSHERLPVTCIPTVRISSRDPKSCTLKEGMRRFDLKEAKCMRNTITE